MQNAHENAFPTGATARENGASTRQGATYRDAPVWRSLAVTRGLRLPARSATLTTRAMERWLHRLGLMSADHARWAGLPTLDAFIERNPGVPLYAWVGQLLETLEYHPWLLEAR